MLSYNTNYASASYCKSKAGNLLNLKYADDWNAIKGLYNEYLYPANLKIWVF
jgi:hypothetical protein